MVRQPGKEDECARRVTVNTSEAQFLTPTATAVNNRPFLVLLTCLAESAWLQKSSCNQYIGWSQKIVLPPGK